MNIVETTSTEYDSLFSKDTICYNTAAFNAMNRSKSEEVYYLLFKDDKLRLGLIVGRKGSKLLSPFSAPFGGFSVLDSALSVKYIEKAVDALMVFCRTKGITELSMTHPPLFYNESFLTKVQHVLFQKGFKMEDSDLNYIFHLKNILSNYSTEILARNAKKNLKIALTKNFTFNIGRSNKDLKDAYEIIRLNREAKGFPLSMTQKEMLQTAKVVRVDSFIVKLEKVAVASAIVYHVTDQILQVIYWGDLPEFATNKTMNFLTYKVFEYYYKKSYNLMDVGTAMLNKKPNYGLCEFKESIGCVLQPKCTFTLHLES